MCWFVLKNWTSKEFFFRRACHCVELCPCSTRCCQVVFGHVLNLLKFDGSCNTAFILAHSEWIIHWFMHIWSHCPALQYDLLDISAPHFYAISFAKYCIDVLRTKLYDPKGSGSVVHSPFSTLAMCERVTGHIWQTPDSLDCQEAQWDNLTCAVAFFSLNHICHGQCWSNGF